MLERREPNTGSEFRQMNVNNGIKTIRPEIFRLLGAKETEIGDQLLQRMYLAGKHLIDCSTVKMGELIVCSVSSISVFNGTLDPTTLRVTKTRELIGNNSASHQVLWDMFDENGRQLTFDEVAKFIRNSPLQISQGIGPLREFNCLVDELRGLEYEHGVE